MLRIAAWLTTVVLIAVLVWQSVVAEAMGRAVAAILLLIVGGLAGLRLGAESASAYIRDLQRLNKFMADHQREVEEINSLLLKQIDAESREPSEPPQASAARSDAAGDSRSMHAGNPKTTQ